MDGQMTLFDKKTNLEMLQTARDAEHFLRLYQDKLGYLCMQTFAVGEAKEVWKAICLSDEYRGEEGCEKCKRRFLQMEFRENFSDEMIEEFLE